jgi:hypothetical protein
MDDEIFKLKNEFMEVKNTVDKIADMSVSIKRKLGQLKEIHTDLIKDNDSKKIFLVCLESFHFQYKVMMFDTDNLQRNFLMLTNRAYFDYYNLYNMLHKLFEDYKIDIPTVAQHLVYNDLEPFSEYSLENIYLVHDNAVELITCLIGKLRENEFSVNRYKSKSQCGIRIANFINTLEYENKIMRDQIELYTNYCNFFQETQLKYFTKLLNKVKALQDDIDADIKFHETPWDETPINESDILIQSVEDCAISQWGLSSEDLENSEIAAINPLLNDKKKNKNKKK